LLKDEYQPNEVTKFSDADLPQPKSQAEALPNSVGLPAA